MRPRYLAVLMALVAACTLNACSTKAADAKTIPNGITVMEVASSPDSLKYVLRWTTTADAFGPVDGYIVIYSSTKGFAFNHIVPSTVDSFTVAKPAVKDSVSFTVKVQATRRGIAGPAASVTWKYIRKDVAPPQPGPIVVDSTQVIGVYIRPHTITVATGDSVQACAFVVMGDSSIKIGVTVGDKDSLVTRNYCSGAPLTQFMSERTT